ncbi:MAG: glycosyltransferase family 4 protein, partial [Actinobacteria bacterium]|nr:glycosyltransferase family 4 protein [Actinomycetota bacterium]
HEQKDIIKHLGLKDSKVAVVPLAAGKEFRVLADTQLIHVRRKYNLPDNFLLYVGDANWVKNLPFLIQGFNELIKSAKFKDLKLVLVGNVFLKNVENINHPELESLKKANRLIKDNNLTDLILRPGFLEMPDLVSFYNLATAYIQPSLYEGFGLPVLEAMNCGAPVICSNGGSLPEIGGESVIYFDPKNLSQFVKILIEVLENKSLQYKLSKLGLQQARNFSWVQTAARTKEIYHQSITNE